MRFKSSQSAHKRLALICYDKAHNAKTSAKQNLFNAKVDYHNDVYNKQRNIGHVLPMGERRFIYNHFMRRYNVPKNLR